MLHVFLLTCSETLLLLCKTKVPTNIHKVHHLTSC
jgi:hypothetical protein